MKQCSLCDRELERHAQDRAGGEQTPYEAPTMRFTTPPLGDGDPEHRHEICRPCANRHQHRAQWCPWCDEVYVTPRDWHNSRGILRPVPCREHSSSTTTSARACDNCGHEIQARDLMVYGFNLRVWCAECLNHVRTCSATYCSEVWHPSDEGRYTTFEDGMGVERYLCADNGCYPVNLPIWFPASRPDAWDYEPTCRCRACRWLHNLDPGRWPHNNANEDTIWRLCVSCDEQNSEQFGRETGDGRFYCHSCAEKLMECYECGRLATDMPVVGRVRKPRCANCLRERGYWFCDVRCQAWFGPDKECRCDGVHRYNYRPRGFDFFTADGENAKRSSTPFLGVELEIEALADGCSRAKGAHLIRPIPWAYAVHDGTLAGNREGGVGGDHGFEIVTHPFTIEWFDENWSTIEELLGRLANDGYRSWEGGRCGMHVHVSRRPMSRAHQMKFINFVYGHPNLCMCVGQRGRKNKYLREFAPFDKEDQSRFIEKVTRFRNPGVDGHYAALNANKRESLEARWFRGTLNPISFRKNVEFIHAVWVFTREFGQTSANEVNFVEWLRNGRDRRRYSTALSYIEENYLTRT